MNLKEIQVYDSLTAKKTRFKPRQADAVRIYCCGPTVYGYTHVGNARAALTLDLVVRTFEYFNYSVFAARNFTDVDDKIIRVAEETQKTCEEVSQIYESAYLDEMKELGIRMPNFSPRATEHIPQMIELIEALIQKDRAYALRTKDGTDVYYRVENFKDYGKLSKRKLDSMLQGTRAETEEGKKHPADFALWKAAKPGEPYWESPWGRGRPGWHIECSAMIDHLFQDNLDIHMGGLDLIFPHHENEIAQSEGVNEKPLANYWVHNGMLEINQEKMSKSLGNIMTTRKFLENYGPECLRMLIYSHHYRSPIDFSAQSIHAAEMSLLRLYHCREKALQSNESSPTSELQNLQNQIESALADDFHSAKAMGQIMSAARTCFKQDQSEYWSAWGAAIKPLTECFGLFQKSLQEVEQEMRRRKIHRSQLSSEKIDEIESLLLERQTLRAAKKFKEADSIREKLEKNNILVMDTVEGSSWSVREEFVS